MRNAPFSKGKLARAGGPASYLALAMRLVSDIDRDVWGSVTPSLYETARVVSAAPWLPGHKQRVVWLLEQQREGGWGEGPAPYRLLPTLSAVEALLSVLRDAPADGRSRERAAAAAAEGLAELAGLLSAGPDCGLTRQPSNSSFPASFPRSMSTSATAR